MATIGLLGQQTPKRPTLLWGKSLAPPGAKVTSHCADVLDYRPLLALLNSKFDGGFMVLKTDDEAVSFKSLFGSQYKRPKN